MRSGFIKACVTTFALLTPQFAAATFSIVAYDAATDEWGVAVASKVLAVGYVVPWAEAGTGAIATQAWANAAYGADGLAYLRDGKSAEETLAALLAADDGREQRQVGVVDAEGNVAAFTGSATSAWAGHKMGKRYTCQGNILAGADVLDAMATAYEGASGPLARRLLAALRAGDDAGGDKRGKESAALLVVRAGGGYQGKTDRLVDIRVDDAAEPVAELARVYDLWESSFVLPRYLDAAGDAEHEMALGIIDRMLARAGDNAEVYNAAAWELASRKLYADKAVAIALRARELAPEDANIMDTVAEAYYAAGDKNNAIAWEEKALARDAENEFFAKQLEKFKEM